MSSSSGIEQNTQNFLQALAVQGDPPIYTLSPEDARNVLRGAQAGVEVDKLPVDIEDHVIPGNSNDEISIRIVRPQGNTNTLPVVVYFHGGGWVLGDKDTHDRLIREIANGAEAAVVFVNYTPSPEAHYPVAIEQGYTATKWVAENSTAINVDSSRLAVVGDSVGGNLAAAVTLLAKERQTPAIAFQVLFYPVTDANFDTESYRQFAGGIWLTREAMKWFWNQYAPDESVRTQPTAAPLQASIEQLQGLPPALIITDEFDVLRDEGEAYAHKLMAAGVTVTATRYLGTIHDFVMLNAIADTPATRAAIVQATTMLRDIFAK
ncbi:alpha/beta hydrolase [Nostocaceae cyanobacterium CENA369]|uniref:Alpha/beta hydrolase n=1 Tax=Dendronalium phyllosphericum CENA369 TaxID=1725256 RepID=A0A8J7LHH5_9NOST|nr:alpha/beta hydrolase [Dendronalium phyllosphericum]MBH8576208.1 alpha/beta hydrolase [Dendronalium phyllosphericum CENA369]